MKFYRLLKNDIRNGFAAGSLHYLVLFLLAALSCVFCVAKVQGVYMFEESVPDITFADFILYLFSGIPRYVPDPTNPFVFPAQWFLLHMVLLYGGLYYPYRDLHTLGTSVLPRSRSRYQWWCSKCLWTLFNQLVSYLCLYAGLLLFCLLLGGRLSLKLTTDYIDMVLGAGSSFDSVSQELLLMAVALPFLVSLALCFCQMTLSLFLKPLFSYLVMAVVLLASAYMESPFLIGNYAMPIRSGYVIARSYGMPEGCMAVFLTVCIVFVIGIVRFRRYDIMSQEER